MLIFCTSTLLPMLAVGLIFFLEDYIGVLTIVGGLFILSIGLLYTVYLKKKDKKHEVITPVTDIIGDSAERVNELNEDIKPFGFAYDPNQDIFYSILNPWQREFGYCRLYDEASAALSMIIDCEPIHFEYNGRKWLIEFWKGQYGMNTGAEVGIYYTTSSAMSIPGIFSGTFYHSVEDKDCINMSFALRKKGNLLFTRSGFHWWLTGFKLGEFSKPSELTLDIVLELYDKRMTYTFVNALVKAGYKDNEYRVQNNKVYIHYDKPHTPQPVTRTAFTDFLMLKNDENLCSTYNELTKEYPETLDKLVVLRKESPGMYNNAINIGKPHAVYDAFVAINEHLDKD